jgi:hypothetical protein
LAIERARLEKIEERKQVRQLVCRRQVQFRISLQRREAVAAELKERMRILRGEEDGSENSGDRSSAETEDDTQPHEPQQYRTQTTITTVTIE